MRLLYPRGAGRSGSRVAAPLAARKKSKRNRRAP
jgi:hypothetical protein